jgi:adenine-specific DNA-methyltransferase
MFAMAYCSQSTGHYAQFRDIRKENINDILIYRKKEILPLFESKFNSLRAYFDGSNNTNFKHEFSSLNYLDVLQKMRPNSIVYADPPYQFVHYSRFYHALETLVKYDYPEVEHKGRYRTDRHQSPFCIRTQVAKAFSDMFVAIYKKESSLVLSYSNSGMITLNDLLILAKANFPNYSIHVKELDYLHSTMGRQGDKSRNVTEVLVVCSKK